MRAGALISAEQAERRVLIMENRKLPNSSSAKLSGEEFALLERDTFVAPSWNSLEIEARSELVLFGYSDRAAQEKLGLWRELKG